MAEEAETPMPKKLIKQEAKDPRDQYTKEQLCSWIDILRGTSKAQYNCSRISLAILKVLIGGQAPTQKANTYPSSFKFITALPEYAKIKGEDGKRRNAVLHSALDLESQFVQRLALEPDVALTVDLTDENTDISKEIFDISRDDSKAVIMTGISSSELTEKLSSSKDSFGFVCFASGSNPQAWGHMISYYVNKDGKVYYMDAHNDLMPQEKKMSRVFEDFSEYMSKSDFQKKVFYKEVGRSLKVQAVASQPL